MKSFAVTALILAAGTALWPQTATSEAMYPRTLAPADVRAVSPALSDYVDRKVLGDLWGRGELVPRDRSIVTLSVLIARGQTVELPFHLARALDNGVTPLEISELITHLAFYSGLANAYAAVPAAKQVFADRGVGADQLAPVSPNLFPLDAQAEARRAEAVETSTGAISPGLVLFTADLLFKDLWLRPGLAPRDRSLVTVASLIANGHSGQLPFHLNRAMDSGLTQTQAGEVITQVAFYAGWPTAFSAVPVAADVFRARASK